MFLRIFLSYQMPLFWVVRKIKEIISFQMVLYFFGGFV